MKRFQECNRLEKIFRYRWYLLLPFQYFYYSYIKSFKVYRDEIIDDKFVHGDEYDIFKGTNLWNTLKSMLQYKMNWYYTMDEVKEKLFKKYKKNR